jgi:hypothetical protein
MELRESFKMQKQRDEFMQRFMGTLNRPKREKSEQSNQQKTSSQDCAGRAAPDTLFEKNLQWLENLDSEVRQNISG